MKYKLLIVLTATCRPAVQSRLVISNFEERFESYRSSLDYIHKEVGGLIDVAIVFSDNSGAAGDMRGRVPGRIIFHDCATDYDISRGKGWGEALNVDSALSGEVASFINDDTIILKITGRLQVSNIRAIVLGILNSSSGGVWVRLRESGLYADTRVIAFRYKYWGAFLKSVDEINEERGFYLEHCFAKAIFSLRQQGGLWKRLSPVPQIHGRSGSTGAAYSMSFFGRLGEEIKSFVYHIILARRNEW